MLVSRRDPELVVHVRSKDRSKVMAEEAWKLGFASSIKTIFTSVCFW